MQEKTGKAEPWEANENFMYNTLVKILSGISVVIIVVTIVLGEIGRNRAHSWLNIFTIITWMHEKSGKTEPWEDKNICVVHHILIKTLSCTSVVIIIIVVTIVLREFGRKRANHWLTFLQL